MNIKVRIGAVVDGDLSKIIFEPIEAGAARARRKIKTEMGGAAADVAKANEGATRQQEAAARAAVRNRLNMERDAARSVAAMDRERFREQARARGDQYRAELAMQRDLAREERHRVESTARAAAALGSRAASGAMSTTRAVVSRGVGLAGDLARGAGVNLDVQGMVRDYVSRQSMATDLSNAAFMPGGKGAAGVRQNPAQLMKEAASVAQETALDPTKIIEGMQKFVGKTGDLQGARDTIKELAILSQATGTDISSMVDAAGDAFANLGDNFKTGEEKARAVVDVMKAMSGQGKLGAVEVKDMAVQMAGLAAVAGTFSGDRVQNMALLGAIAQEARQRGGAKSASQAVGSVQSLMGIFGKKARLQELQAKGVDVFTDKSQTQVRDVQSIIVSALSKTRGSIPQLNKMFMDVQAQRAVRGFSTVYSEEYRNAKSVKGTSDSEANAKAVAAVNAEFERLKGATMKEAEIRDSFAAKMETAESKAQKFQNQLQAITDKMATNLLPELERVGPKMADFATKLADFATWAGKNPYQAGGAVVGIAVLKAGTEALISNAVSGGVSKAMASGLGGMLGAGGLAITAAAVTLYAMSELVKVDKGKKTSAEESTEETLHNVEKVTAELGMERGREQNAQAVIDEEMAKSPEKRDAKRLAEAEAKKKEAKAKQEELEARARDLQSQLAGDLENADKVDGVKKGSPSLPGMDSAGISSWITSIVKGFGGNTGDAVDRRDVANAEATAKRLAEVKGAVDGLGKILSSGLVIKSMPTGAPSLPRNVTR